MASDSNRGIVRLTSPWPVVLVPMGEVTQGAENATFLVLVGWRA